MGVGVVLYCETAWNYSFFSVPNPTLSNWESSKATFPVLFFDFRCYLFLLLGLLPCQTTACKQGSVRSPSSYAAGNQ
jgi:hypothetical protein